MFRRFLAAMVACCSISSSVAFGEVAAQSMVPDNEAKSWYAIAKLNIAGNRWCNAVLISETEVLTAAHCLFHPITKHLAEAKDIKVVLGQRRNEYAALRGVTDHAVLPGFSPGLGDSADLNQIAVDLALLRLDAPVSPQDIQPLEITDWLSYRSVSVTGYGRDRPFLPSIREDCELTPVSTNVATLDCTIVPGLSGAPVVGKKMDDESRPLMGLVSANLHDPTGMKTGEGLVVGIGSRLEVLRGLLP